ncbi:3-hydroxyacyl-CoA dehydrogenase [Halovenus sp. WSH3]|uniref:3-hydroxyacyl-CoA dehydrogenase n=1 Tax=Halovenus carboxidivorans TaxID=2692199 RepID=A0A6B0T7W2_9EURY|nr:3-hydroxyacyl-CoA dehydrogenase/enoyl-CoA hydratase family protein [Halovenus carboxidivorans]MXR50980.1 3-hydroxyacyl-CoA dehydrogenase [Halovenus carboxidivorans]
MELADVDTITVLGAGTMGHGIAEVAALSGYSVKMRDIKEEFVEDGYEQITWSLDKLAENERITEEEAEAAKENVTPLVDIEEAMEGSDVVIEAAPENMDIKADVYEEVVEYAPEHTVFTSNTSSLSITDLSELTDRPERFCGMHFFNPPVRMDLVEVIRGEHTSDETMDLIEDLAADMGKTPVRVRKDEPGFIVNSILVPLMNEACWIVEEDVATIAEVDSSTKYGMGLPMGAFELGDQVGNDVTYHVLEYMHEVLGAAYEPCPLLAETVENDHLGKKTGKGFYDYEDGEGADVPADQVREDVLDRLYAVLANETGKLIQKDVAPPEDIDEAVTLGAGFPKGPAKLCDEEGLDDAIATLEELQESSDATRYEVSDGLRDAAEEGGFYGADEEDDAVEFETIRVEYPTEMVGQIVLDRPHQLNTVNPEMLDEFGEAVDMLDDDEDVRAILVTGAGDRAFSAGADAMSMAGSANPIDAIELSRKGQETWAKLEDASVPTVAGIDGFALGGGMELAACADLRIATERSELGQPEFNLGLLPGWGGTQRLKNHIGESRAKEVIFTAERYEAETMHEWGFVNRLTDKDSFEEDAVELAADLAAGPPLAMEYTKKAMHAGRDDTEAGLETEAFAFGHLIATDDVMEGVTKIQSDEEPEFEGK